MHIINAPQFIISALYAPLHSHVKRTTIGILSRAVIFNLKRERGSHRLSLHRQIVKIKRIEVYLAQIRAFAVAASDEKVRRAVIISLYPIHGAHQAPFARGKAIVRIGSFNA